MLARGIAAELLKGPNRDPGGIKLLSHFVTPELPTGEMSIDNSQTQQFRIAKVVSDLLYGILRQDGRLFDGCRAELKKQGGRFFTKLSSLWNVLREAIKKCHTDSICILIDGIDGFEATLCNDLIERVLGLANIPKVKIFLSSRIVPVVSNNLSQHMKINLDGNDFVKGDVETFIRQKVNRLKWGEGQKERVGETLLAKAEGIFLWASLAIKNLASHCSEPDFDAFLEESPSELEGVYQKMLRRINERRGSKKVLDMMRCVALAVRPLTFYELSHFLVYMEGKAKSKQRSPHGGGSTGSQPTEKEIEKSVQSCQGFLRSVTGTVSMVHHTAVEYLFDEERDDGLPKFSKRGLDFAISWECFKYLHAAFDDLGEAQEGGVSGHNDKPGDSNSKRESQEEEPGEIGWELAPKRAQEAAAKKYLRYAAESWFVHAGRSIEISKPEDKFYDEKTHNWFQYPFFETGDTIRKPWIVLCGDPRMEDLAGEQTPLHIAVCLGLIPLVEEALLRFKEETNSMQSPLHLAAKFMSGAYKVLVSKGGPWILTNPDEDGNTPLHQATIFGRLSMMKGLMERFTEDNKYREEINKVNDSGNTPLHLAVQFDHQEIVEFLIEKGADITIKNSAQLTASGLGGKLGRGDIANILKKQERIRRPKRAGKPAGKPPAEPPRKPGRGLWRSVGRLLVGLWQERWGVPRRNPRTARERDREDSTRRQSGDGRHRSKRTRSRRRTSSGQ